MIVDEYKVKHKMLLKKIDHYSDLAQKAGISARTARDVLGSDKWRADTVTKIATALECNPLDLITVVGINEIGEVQP